MATHKSAIKRHRQNLKRNEANRQARSAIRTAIKSVHALASKGEKEAALKEAQKASGLLDKAASKSLIHRNAASRNISRLYQAINSAK